MNDVERLQPIIVDLADDSNTIDLNTVNLVLLTVPGYSNRAIDDVIRVYFDDTLYSTYYVESIVGGVNIKINKDWIRKQDYSIYYTITDVVGNINRSDSKVFHFRNIDERFKLGEPLFPDARENVIDMLTVSNAGGLRVITDYQYIQAGHKIRFYWRAVYTGTDTVIGGTEYTSPEITVNTIDVQNGYKGITIPVYHIEPAKDIGTGQCYYTVVDSLMQASSQPASIKIVSTNWNDGSIHTYYTTGIARNNPNYPALRPYNSVTVVGKPGRKAIIDTNSGVLIDLGNVTVNEFYFTFDETGQQMFKLFLNEEIPPFGPGSVDTEEETLTYHVAYMDDRFNGKSPPISFNNYVYNDRGPITAYSFHNQAYNDNKTPIQVLVKVKSTVLSNKINVKVDGHATINHISPKEDILLVDYTASFFVFNNYVEENTITINIDSSAYPITLKVKFTDPTKASI
ncbi:hypothetical protein FHW72_002188 [Ochrobactrum sp. RC6B]|nr:MULTISPECIES: hypothetical protein [unclassified Ochrobactrum]MBA8845484.1 hypothetical protein [Ochrobactrum sp. RH1CCR137]MBA8856987.1 hypothetical protein [Ochrobactrum sp. RH1CCR134]MBB3217106.1 hypothetical protein [Ochrobactrum sp. RC6B]